MKIESINYSENTCQKNQQSEQLLALEAFVRLITDKWTSKPPKERNLNNTIYAQAAILKEEHNSGLFFINLDSPRKGSIAEQWEDVKGKISLIVEDITKDFLVVGGILSIEMHKKTSKTNKRGKDSKAGYPHLLLMLWITHTKLYEDIEEKLIRFFLALNFEVEVVSTSTRKDIKKYLAYTIKEAADPDLIGFCKQYLQLPATTMVWTCHPECRNIFEEIQRSLNKTKKKYSSFFKEIKQTSLIPTTRKENNKDLILAQIFHKLFRERGWAVYLDKIYRRQYNTKFIWEEYKRLDLWLTQPDREYDNEQIQKLKTSINIRVITDGVTNKDSLAIPKCLFPNLIIEKDLIEFEDSLYNFETGRIEREKESSLTWCINYFPIKYEELKPPYLELEVIYLLLNKQDTVIANEIVNESVWSLLENLVYYKQIREIIKTHLSKLDKRDRDEKEKDCFDEFSLAKSGINYVENKKELAIMINKDRWEEVKKSASTNIKERIIETNLKEHLIKTSIKERIIEGETDDYIWLYTSIAFPILLNSFYLKMTKKKEIDLPEKWYKESKPNEKEKEEIEGIGLKCFKHTMRKLNN